MRVSFSPCLFFMLAFILCAVPDAHAKDKDTAPSPPHKTQSLESLEAKMQAEKAAHKKLQDDAKKIEDSLGNIKQDLISTTEKVQNLETEMQDLEERRITLSAQKKILGESLAKQRQTTAKLIMALERIRRLPPETLIAKPDAPLETAQAATVLSSIVPQINAQAARLRVQLEHMQEIETTMLRDEESLKLALASFKTEKSKMDDLMDARQKTLRETQQKMSAKTLEIAALSKQAKDFKDLIKKLEQQNRKQAEQKEKEQKRNAHKNEETRTAAATSANRLYEPLPSMGSERLPVSGIIKTRYGEKDALGATSEGITLHSREGSVVVAPMGGIVRYCGDFRTYGNIVLIEHKNKYHSLVAGLGKLDTFVGQSVDAGEPIGRLPSSSGKLYYELRYQGDPINPSRKFSNID